MKKAILLPVVLGFMLVSCEQEGSRKHQEAKPASKEEVKSEEAGATGASHLEEAKKAVQDASKSVQDAAKEASKSVQDAAKDASKTVQDAFKK